MEDKIFEYLMIFLNHWGYSALFVMTFLEASALLGLFVPGETMVVIAGIVASKGVLDLHHVIWVSALGAIIGDTAGYFIGLYFGEKLFLKYGRHLFLKEERLEEAKGFLENHGGKTIFIGRFMSLLRAFAPVIAGMTRMSYPRFLVFNVTGGAAWAVVFSLLGYFVGNSWDSIRPYFSYGARIGMLAIATGFIIALIVRRRDVILEKVDRVNRALSAQMPKTWGFVKSCVAVNRD